MLQQILKGEGAMIFQVEIRQIDRNNNNPNNSGLGSALFFIAVLFMLFILFGPNLESMLEAEPPSETARQTMQTQSMSEAVPTRVNSTLTAQQKIKFERLLELETKRGGMRLDQNEITRLTAGDYAVEQAYQNYLKTKRRTDSL